ncbi:chaperone protein DNAJ, putative [Trypanosoma brucei brucei TREU927]|uniref:Chaperone protein DNAJ, putative n=1 Tax=Trypanosoma brucei brucei (strain 927/4 GUTat10.1) TaxID=185431 RepID=Q380Y9_TRYB2|nr:chaperone protein DnaJ [Trypanosoma brucei brucei TREU927]EAN80642.1 chaperone protein DNAJ, putative [Trypanosoma brucei brucei TREU927]
MGSDVFELIGNTALYEVLGVPRTATDAEIRRAYYKLAVVYHPDKNPEGVEVFKEVSFAHSILSDPTQREMYDNQRLRTHIEGQARKYDPMMDPNVELSAEELRLFVERKRKEDEEKMRNRSEFEKQREEEMRRRAEYDAQNPDFKAEYERMRARAKEEGSQRASAASAMRHLTTAELMQRLEMKQQEATNSGIGRVRSGDPGKSGANPSSGLSSIKRSMLNDFRTRHDSAPPTAESMQLRAQPPAQSSRLDFVGKQNEKSYTCEMEKLIGKYSNFNYRDFVEKGIVDGDGVMEAAILADALGNYDRSR